MPVGDVRGAEARRQSGAGRLLVVDDDPLVRRSIGRFLRAKGFEVLEVTNAEEGRDLMQSQGFDVVLTDVCMPGMSGVDLLAALREDDSFVPIILITGKPSVDAAVECMKIGAFDYLTKPVQAADLLQRIRAALQPKQAVGENSAVMTAPGARFSGYRVIRVLGEGSGGVVCQVEKKDGDTRQEYALKILKISGLSPGQIQTLRQRFLHKAEAASKVQHPHVIRFIDYDVTRHEEIPYMVMEYYPHPSLATDIATSRPKEPRKQDPQFPLDLQLILARMLKKDLPQRYQSAAAVTEDLQQYLASGKLKQGWCQQVVDTFTPDWS